MDAGVTDRLRLKVTAGNAEGTEIEVREELLIGRQVPEPGKLGDDIEISREHARIKRAGESDYVLEDLGSRNGTFLNGRRVTDAESLTVGDKIELGQTTLVVQYTAPDRLSPTTVRATVEPEPEPEPEPELELELEAEPEPEARPERPGRLSLRLELDPESGEARLELDEGSEAVTLRWEDGRWRIAPPP